MPPAGSLTCCSCRIRKRAERKDRHWVLFQKKNKTTTNKAMSPTKTGKAPRRNTRRASHSALGRPECPTGTSALAADGTTAHSSAVDASRGRKVARVGGAGAGRHRVPPQLAATTLRAAKTCRSQGRQLLQSLAVIRSLRKENSTERSKAKMHKENRKRRQGGRQMGGHARRGPHQRHESGTSPYTADRPPPVNSVAKDEGAPAGSGDTRLGGSSDSRGLAQLVADGGGDRLAAAAASSNNTRRAAARRSAPPTPAASRPSPVLPLGRRGGGSPAGGEGTSVSW